jgi:hypothetical protein
LIRKGLRHFLKNLLFDPFFGHDYSYEKFWRDSKS